MSSTKRSSFELTANQTGDERPLSFYDNITAGSSSSSGATKVIQIPDIQFKFDDAIPITADPRRSTLLMSNAKSDFFGLSKIPANGISTTDGKQNPDDAVQETQALISDSDDRKTPPPILSPVASSSSPMSTASTALARSSGTPEGSPGLKSRPVSSTRNITIKLPDESAPSEAVYMTTTVPQNFSKNSTSLIGRHKPTRSSLRHSRMLVVNKTFHQRYPKGNSLNLRHIRLSKTLMVLKIIIGALLTLMGMTIIVWSPNTHTKDNPYWSGMVLVLSGTLFLILFDFKRRPSNRLRENCYNFIRVNALVILLLTIFFTMLAFIYALIHSTYLSSSQLLCEPEYKFNINSSSCVCLIDTRSTPMTEENDTSEASELRGSDFLLDEDGTPGRINRTLADRNKAVISGIDLRRTAQNLEEQGITHMEYRDFNCSEVLGIWYYFTLCSTMLNSIGCLLAAAFLVIYSIECLWRRELNEVKYVGVRTNPAGAIETNNDVKMETITVPNGRQDESEAARDAGGGSSDGTPETPQKQSLPSTTDVVPRLTESIDTKEP
ncbi:uncharacterized protein LOC129751590 [Uranotaenia lowii]|uniref:uncharacterized protein LOC129751590 n=1 Tax=Uranotaenia lowii TaxID=190385 RepID=UPI00247A2953|nr:uncharacterized protein LOC129751590 [Uranotaenia lowii]